jgi:hypothetical protein
VKERYHDSSAREKSGHEVVDHKTSHMYSTLALTDEGDLKVDEKEARPRFGLEARKKEGGRKGAPARVCWPLNKAGVHVFMQFWKTSMLMQIRESSRMKQGGGHKRDVVM